MTMVIFKLLTVETVQLTVRKHFPHFVIVDEFLFEIVLALTDNISKHKL